MKNNEVGKVKFYNQSKGFGFIERESACDVFVQLNDQCGSTTLILVKGQQVTFTLVDCKGNPQAENITIIGSDLST